MKYVCLVHLDEAVLDALSPADAQALDDASLDTDQELKRSGHLIAAQALQRVRTATIVRVRNNKLSVTDGPFMETKEQLGGFVLIEARDLNEAIQVAAKLPVARLGSIEVRPVMEIRHS